jgi:hypothetical protein
MTTREQLIVEVWERMGLEVAGASELAEIQEALAKRFGPISPAAIARVLADNDARLGHPQVLQADSRWREQHSLFTADELALESVADAVRLMEKITRLQFEESVRQSVRELKTELALVAKSPETPKNHRDLAVEVAQWLTVWLQSPQIFAQWLDLRRATPEFQERFR